MTDKTTLGITNDQPLFYTLEQPVAFHRDSEIHEVELNEDGSDFAALMGWNF